MQNQIAKPFLHWAGGKTQLLGTIAKHYQFNSCSNYVEPFVGGGCCLFDILNNYDLEYIHINDLNKELICCYRVIKNNVDNLVSKLSDLQQQFSSCDSEGKKQFYYQKRKQFNDLKQKSNPNELQIVSLFIFLNKTCFNGLYRVNKKGEFNVPLGKKNYFICDEKNLRYVSTQLQNVTMTVGSYESTLSYIDDKSFVYLDPPYRPLTTTSNFSRYTETPFGDLEQIQLAKFVKEIDKKGAKFLLSNSDPKNVNPDDDFFEDLYKGFTIERVTVRRCINCNSSKRGKLFELLIHN